MVEDGTLGWKGMGSGEGRRAAVLSEEIHSATSAVLQILDFNRCLGETTSARGRTRRLSFTFFTFLRGGQPETLRSKL